MAKKYYWLKLQKDFFKKHHIKIIEQMPNGKDYILFYMKLLVESISHEGKLRFSDTIPYNDDMLSTITDTNIDIVRSAVKIFTEFELMTIESNGTIYMMEVMEMIGAETDWAEKKRLYRAKKVYIIETTEGQKRTMSDKSKSLEKDIELEKDKDNKEGNKSPSRKKFIIPLITELEEYCKEKSYTVDCEAFLLHYESNGWLVGKNKMKSWKAALGTWSKNSYGKQPEKRKEIPKEMPEGLKNIWN